MNGFRSFLSKSTLQRSFRLAVPHKVILVALKYINPGNVVGLAPRVTNAQVKEYEESPE